MSELSLELDKRAQEIFKDLMHHYNVQARSEIVSKAINLLNVVSYIQRTDGELIVRKGTHETKLVIR